MSCLQDFREEFRLRKAGFGDINSELFYKCRWWDVRIPLLLFRLAVLIHFIVVFIVEVVYASNRGIGNIIMVAFTTWSYIIVLCYFLFATITSVMAVFHAYSERRAARNRKIEVDAAMPDTNEQAVMESPTPESAPPIPWYMKVQWCLYNVGLPSSILVTLVYWIVLYPMRQQNNGFVTHYIDIALHGLNSVFMVIEQYISNMPTRIVHVYQPIVYGLIYMICSVAFWSVTGIVLYPFVLDWTTPITAASIVGILIYYFGTQVALYLIYRAQSKCLSRRAAWNLQSTD